MARESVNTIESARKNLFINGGMDHWERRKQIQNTTPNVATLIATPQYSCVDRFFVEWSATVDGNLALERFDGDLPSADPNIKYALRARGNSTASTNFRITQRVESNIAEEAAGKQVTLSFWYKFDAATIVTASSDSFLRVNYAGDTDNWALAETEIERIAVDGNFTFDGTWRRFERTYTVPAAGANGLEMDLKIDLDASSNPSFLVTGFMLTVGESAPEKFTYRAEDSIAELQLCKRYFEKSYDNDVDIHTTTTTGAFQWVRHSSNSDRKFIWFEVQKRAVPSVASYNPATGTASEYRDGSAGVNRAAGSYTTSSSHLILDQEASGWVTMPQGNVGQIHWTADAEL